MILKYRKRPVVIEAVLYDGSTNSLWALTQWAGTAITVDADRHKVTVNTKEGVMTATLGDYVIKGVAGEFYPCKPDIFKATYELVEAAK